MTGKSRNRVLISAKTQTYTDAVQVATGSSSHKSTGTRILSNLRYRLGLNGHIFDNGNNIFWARPLKYVFVLLQLIVAVYFFAIPLFFRFLFITSTLPTPDNTKKGFDSDEPGATLSTPGPL